MKRERSFKKADLILSADWHLREPTSVPRCYVGENFYEDQWEDLRFIRGLQLQHDCPVVVSGDIFDHWKTSPQLLSDTINHLPDKVIVIYGNHDLPQHNLDIRHKCGLYTLIQSGRVTLPSSISHGEYPFLIQGCSWGMEPNNKQATSITNILMWHTMTYLDEEPFPGCTAPNALSLLRKYKDYRLIVTGDNHTPFVEDYKGRLLVNPGSLNRQKASQIDYKPRVYLWYADTNTVRPVYIPIKEGVISREHIEDKEARNERITAYVERLNTTGNVTMSYSENLQIFMDQNKVKKSVQKIIFKSLENAGS